MICTYISGTHCRNPTLRTLYSKSDPFGLFCFKARPPTTSRLFEFGARFTDPTIEFRNLETRVVRNTPQAAVFGSLREYAKRVDNPAVRRRPR